MTPRRLTTLYIKALTATWILVIVPLTMGAYSCTAYQRRSEQHHLRPSTLDSPSRADIFGWERKPPSNGGAQGVDGKDRAGMVSATSPRWSARNQADNVRGIPRPEILQNLAANAAHLCGVPKNLFFALIARESSWNVNAESPSGALGLAQIKPSTLRHVSPTLDPSRPFDRLVGAACYLRMQFDATGDWQKALHRYNAGPSGEVTEQVRSYAKGIMEASNE